MLKVILSIVFVFVVWPTSIEGNSSIWKEDVMEFRNETVCDSCGRSFGCEVDVYGNKICDCAWGYKQYNETCREPCQYDFECLNGGECRNGEGGSSFCECFAHYSGDKCQVDDICDLEEWRSKCRSMGATCRRFGPNAKCECPPYKVYNWMSEMCTDQCNFENCVHGYCGRLFNATDVRCNCFEGYTGHRCDIALGYNVAAILVLVMVIVSVILLIATITIGCLNRKLRKALQQ